MYQLLHILSISVLLKDLNFTQQEIELILELNMNCQDYSEKYKQNI
jgi:hypothetical protein